MTIKTNGSQKEQMVVEVDKKEPVILHYDVEYDTTNPEKVLRNFGESIKGMLSRYEGNTNRISEIEQEILDLEHYMEIGNYKKVPDGYKLYRKLAELRRERRACKNENDLLWPVYEHFHATEFLKKIAHVQGECAKVKTAIDSRVYSVRTDVLDEFVESKDDAGVGLNLLTGETKVMSIPVPTFDEYLENKKKVEESEKKLANELDNKKYSLAWKAEA